MNNKSVKACNLKQLKPYDETMLYSCSISFLSEAYGIVNNLEKYGRDCFGTPLIRKITGIIHTYKIGYGSEEIKEKIELLEKNENIDIYDLRYIQSVINSFIGYFMKCNSFNLRKKNAFKRKYSKHLQIFCCKFKL